MKAREMLEVFVGIEKTLGLFDADVAGEGAVWPLLREWTYTDYLLPQLQNYELAHPDMILASGVEEVSRVHGFAHRLQEFRQFVTAIHERVRYEPHLLARADVVFALCTRICRDGKARRAVALDYFLRDIRGDVAVVDYPPIGQGRTYYHYGDSIAHYRIERILRDGRVRTWRRERIERGLRPLAERVSAEFCRAYGIACKPEDLIGGWLKLLSVRLVLLPCFRSWIRILKPKLLVTVVNYDLRNLIFCEAAHREGVKVAELQHGEIDVGHPAYNLPSKTPLWSPDWLFAWGRFWIEQTSNYALSDALPTGYPYLESALSRSQLKQSRCKTIVFISQGTVGAELSDLAVKVRAGLPQDGYRIVYKLHPSETLSWRRIYKNLAAHDKDIKVVGNDVCSLYDCLATADCLVGSDSTALMEGFAWGIKSFVLSGFARADIMAQFVSSGAVEFVRDAFELVERLRTQELGPQKPILEFSRSLWQDNASTRIAAAINERIRR